MLIFLPILLAATQASVPAPTAAPPSAQRGRQQVFIAPSGEPFRAYGDTPYPIAQWFSGADKNGDGKLDSSEFDADFLRFFEALDINHDGVIDAGEKLRYENTVAPETQGNSTLGAAGEQTTFEDFNAPDVDPPKPKYGAIPFGAARFDLLGLPEPVAAMDLRIRGRISRADADEAARTRFRQLDTQHRGYLTLDALPKTFAQGRGVIPRAKY